MDLSCLLLLSLIASASVTTFAAPPAACDLSTLVPKLTRDCHPNPDVPSFLISPTAQCCEALGPSLPAQQEAALPCLCRAAADPRLIAASLDASRLFALYRGCSNGNFSRGLNFADFYCEVEKTGDLPTAVCGAASLAARVSRFCVVDKRPAECCMAVVPTVGYTGRPPCLCRVLAEPQLAATGLNITDILELHAACGASRLVGADACKDWHLPPPVLGHQSATTAAVLSPTAAAAAASCTPSTLAFSMVSYVLSDRTVQSCKHLVASVDLGGGVPCLCLVAGEFVTISAGLKATDLLAIYNACGGLHLGGADHKAAAASCQGYGLPLPLPPSDKTPTTPLQQYRDGGVIRDGPDTSAEKATA